MTLENFKIFETDTFVQPIHHKLIITYRNRTHQDEFS